MRLIIKQKKIIKQPMIECINVLNNSLSLDTRLTSIYIPEIIYSPAQKNVTPIVPYSSVEDKMNSECSISTFL